MTSEQFPNARLLLHPQIPKPLHLVNPRTIMGKEWWNDVRRRAYWRYGFCCHACAVVGGKAKHQQGLEAHEVYDINYLTGCVTYLHTVALCHFCHNYIHMGRLEQLYAKGTISGTLFQAINRHGRRVLRNAGLSGQIGSMDRLVLCLRESGNLCKWEDYHLIIEGIRYEPRFKSYEEWLDYWEKNG